MYSFICCSLSRFAHHLRSFKDVFTFPEDSSYGSNFGCYLALHPLLSTPEDRTKAVADVVKLLAGELIPGIRNEVLVITKYLVFDHTQKKLCRMSHRFAEHISTSFSFCKFRLSDYLQLYPVKSSFGTPEFFSLERAAAPYFGIKVHNIYHIIHYYMKLFHFFSAIMYFFS